MTAKIGVQAMMLKEKVEELGAYETFKKVHELGYHSIEVSQIPMTEENVSEIKRATEEFGMKIASMTAGLKPMQPGQESLTTDFDKIVKDCHTLDCDLLRIGMLPFEAMASLEKVIEFSREANAVAEKLTEEGIKLYYHNHHIEFTKYDGEYLLDIIRREAPLLGFELDVHWVHRGGLNPVDVINDYKGKVELIHLKDYRVNRVPESALDALYAGDMKTFMQQFTDIIEFAELGTGSLDFKAIIEASLEAGVRYLLVEQDDQYGRDPFDCLKDSRDYLVGLGYGELF
ncbi:sugar phosphate isomerase [Halolactibacillus miurensis]|uniref:Sugar phosphate isomerase n=1 Tax=Halolactibacillus miurensis TaxID=306541 RepID=A0A1I6P9T9_9BACI|nr:MULTISPECIES: sugar phosphate isomerase/epimerase [Halolactibacillus]GEM03034.1 sugar phosphate isomerase [Halolactibacillus miurensis]SFS36858.1 Sugar phosphate isomerase/epimerase [Halolactibacillus miurensis]